MATQKFAAVDMKGFSPAVDATQSDSLFVLSGRNYVFDTKGPMSSFGNRYLAPQPRSRPGFAQGVRVHLNTGDRCFFFDGDGIWEWNEKLGGYEIIYLTSDATQQPNRWTLAYLAGRLYFCHPRTGLLVLDLETNVCLPHDQAGVATPVNAIAVAVNNGRLGVMDPIYMSWSAPGEGLDFTPNLGGGGFQQIAERVSGTPIMITSYSGGFLTWTTSGVLRSEFTGDAAVYRHRSLDTDYRPVNSFCVSRVDDDSVIILDERGLFKSKGDQVTPYAPLFNEFLIAYIRANQLKLGQNMRIEWDELSRYLYVSISLTYGGHSYDVAYVYYPPLDKWGAFNEEHFGILPIRINDSTRSGDYYGFVDRFGCVKYWIGHNSRESVADIAGFGTSNLWYPAIQKPVQFSPTDPVRVVSATAGIYGFNANGLNQKAGYYRANGLYPQSPAIGPLDSILQFGLFRPTGSVASDEMSEVLNILIRSYESNPNLVTIEDLETLTGDVDLETDVTPNEDYGLAVLTANHSLRLISTLDGVSEYASQVPMLAKSAPGARYYACSLSGVWHKIEISAQAPGESFHVQTGEITATSAGRLL